jgi:hypothetical protein
MPFGTGINEMPDKQNYFEKILFIDVDGVLNTRSAQLELGTSALLPELVGLLATIVGQTNAGIVVSSTWRYRQCDMDQLMTALAGAGIDGHVIGKTPILDLHARDAEIKQWLTENPTKRFAILDDDQNAGRGELARSFFWVSSIVGFQETDVVAVVKHLNA